METKEELKAKLKKIEDAEYQALIDEHYPHFQAMIGKCFKYKNCYSCPESEDDYWWKYTKIASIEKDDLYVTGDKVLSYFKGISFEKCKGGKIIIESEYNTYVHCIGDEILQEEYDVALNLLKHDLSQIL